jgi:hypothetical protein
VLQRLIHDEALAWRRSVNGFGGAVSDARLALMKTLFDALAPIWPLIADAWMLAAENQVQALVSLKQRRLGIAVNSPAFPIDRGYQFDGAANYVDSGFIASTHAASIGMGINNCRVCAREQVDLAANAWTLGAFSGSIRSLSIRARNAAATAQLEICSGGNGVATLLTQSSATMVSGQRTGPATIVARQNGQPMSVTAPTSWATALPSVSLWFGGRNSSGTLNVPKACTLAYASIGATMTDAQAQAEANAVNQHLSSIGA